jgi:uncharacterized protein YjbI with pentapeptide repeats
MANPKHLQILEQGVETWNTWLEQDTSFPSIIPDLSAANLSKANLSRADLSHVDLTMANLSEASLSFAALFGASLVEADLTGANLGYRAKSCSCPA